MKTPPKLFLWLLNVCCPTSRIDLKGDLLELYESRVKELGKFRADLKFLKDIFSVLPLKFIIKEEFRSKNTIALFASNLKMAGRTLIKHKGFTSLNIVGLALGLATCMLITFYIIDELRYDRYHSKADRIYRVNTEINYGGAFTPYAIAAPPVAEALVETFPEVEKAVRLVSNINSRFVKGNEIIQEDHVLFADPQLFEIFTLPFLYGDSATALSSPNTTVITESIAKKYFNRTDVVGETLLMVSDSLLYTITGVIRDMPQQSHFKADFFFSMHGHKANKDVGFNKFTFNTYILLKNGASPQELEEKLPDFFRDHLSSAMDMDRFEHGGNYIRIGLMPMTDIHLHSNRQSELGSNGDIRYIYIFSAIAMLILALACINFMNLSTARSANRAKEVGIRKVLGSFRRQLIVQFLAESLSVTFIAGIIALISAYLLLPYFNEVAGKNLTLIENIAGLLYGLIIVILFVGILAGCYPAFFLSGFQPAQVLKGKLAAGFKGGWLRNVLVVFQFSISTFLIIGTLVIYNQLDFIQNKDLGFDRQQVLIIKNASALDHPELFREEIKQLAGVVNASVSGYLPTGGARWRNSISNQGGGFLSEFWLTDSEYIPTLGMTLIKGRNFSEKLASDSLAIIINETAAKMLECSDEPLEKIVHAGGGKDYHVVGVIKDFNFNSLRDNITPLVLVTGSDWRASIAVRIQAFQLSSVLKQIETKWKTIAPGVQMDYSFMDKDFEALYNTEQRMQKLFMIFTMIAIGIACLGLFGLSAYAAEQRNREISIRKILGATVTNLLAMLSGDFIKLVIVSIGVATPVAWFVMQWWLQSFAYRAAIPWWSFVFAAFGTIVIALVTVSFQSFKAAVINPIENLRSE